MITVGKVLRKVDKEAICRAVVASKGFATRKGEAETELGEIIKKIGLAKIQEEFECSENGALKLYKNDYCSVGTVFLFNGNVPNDQLEWYQTRESLPYSCNEFGSGRSRVFIAKTERMNELIEIIMTETKAKKDAERAISTLLESFSSSKKLLESIPDLSKFVRISNEGSTSLVPMSTIESVKELLK